MAARVLSRVAKLWSLSEDLRLGMVQIDSSLSNRYMQTKMDSSTSSVNCSSFLDCSSFLSCSSFLNCSSFFLFYLSVFFSFSFLLLFAFMPVSYLHPLLIFFFSWLDGNARDFARCCSDPGTEQEAGNTLQQLRVCCQGGSGNSACGEIGNVVHQLHLTQSVTATLKKRLKQMEERVASVYAFISLSNSCRNFDFRGEVVGENFELRGQAYRLKQGLDVAITENRNLEDNAAKYLTSLPYVKVCRVVFEHTEFAACYFIESMEGIREQMKHFNRRATAASVEKKMVDNDAVKTDYSQYCVRHLILSSTPSLLFISWLFRRLASSPLVRVLPWQFRKLPFCTEVLSPPPKKVPLILGSGEGLGVTDEKQRHAPMLRNFRVERLHPREPPRRICLNDVWSRNHVGQYGHPGHQAFPAGRLGQAPREVSHLGYRHCRCIPKVFWFEFLFNFCKLFFFLLRQPNVLLAQNIGFSIGTQQTSHRVYELTCRSIAQCSCLQDLGLPFAFRVCDTRAPLILLVSWTSFSDALDCIANFRCGCSCVKCFFKVVQSIHEFRLSAQYLPLTRASILTAKGLICDDNFLEFLPLILCNSTFHFPCQLSENAIKCSFVNFNIVTSPIRKKSIVHLEIIPLTLCHVHVRAHESLRRWRESLPENLGEFTHRDSRLNVSIEKFVAGQARAGRRAKCQSRNFLFIVVAGLKLSSVTTRFSGEMH
eukprot:284817307_4